MVQERTQHVSSSTSWSSERRHLLTASVEEKEHKHRRKQWRDVWGHNIKEFPEHFYLQINTVIWIYFSLQSNTVTAHSMLKYFLTQKWTLCQAVDRAFHSVDISGKQTNKTEICPTACMLWDIHGWSCLWRWQPSFLLQGSGVILIILALSAVEEIQPEIFCLPKNVLTNTCCFFFFLQI